MKLALGDSAPDFSLPDENGDLHRLSEYRGKTVVLFFYPEDDTPGCTKEACNFRDDYSKYKEAGAEVLGISPDDSQSHEAFKSKYSLPFTLLADKGHKVCEEYGVWGGKKLFGFEYEGVHRSTFVIDPEGKIAKIFKVNRIEQHSQDVLEALESPT
jgi:peroxiredoxin Q/BCP